MKQLKKLFSKLGPGFVTGASDDDPSGIATYAQTGALFGYTQLWTALFSFPLMTAVQEMCGRIGMVTGCGIAAVIKKHYAKPVLYVAVLLLFTANTINIGADLGAMAAAAKLLIDLPFTVLLLVITAFTLLLVVYVPYATYATLLKYLTLSLFAYIITAFFIHQDWQAITFATFFPHISFDKAYLLNIVAILGTTISPYLFFWQADEEVEEEITHKKLYAMGKGLPQLRSSDIKNMRVDTIIGMFFSNLVMFFIMISTASTLHTLSITHIDTADQAALALRPFAGNFASLLFAAGVVGTGLLAVPILAGSASYAISEAMDWKAGLGNTFSQAHGFYMTIILATVIGLFVNFTSIKPFEMLYYTAILNGICAPPLLFLILLIANNRAIMGDHVNSLMSNIMGLIITVVMTAALTMLLLTIG